ncbi:MAG: Gfo/Idh/MocA family oxidoreductase [Planctomycetaceae bacterium]|nr:Gfo/Idh/MocA family oxidoreductase [Planctomycetaceae bacterium]
MKGSLMTMSRRQFAGASLAASTLMAVPTILSADDKPSERVTVGVMGLSRGMSLARTFGSANSVKVKYVCDIDQDRMRSGVSGLEQATGQVAEGITDFRRILDDKECDVLICAAPNHWHAPATILGVSAGKHVYVEKPCSHNPWEGETMVAAARKYDRAVQMGSQRRSGKGYQEAIQKLHGGIIGNVYSSRSWYNNLRPTVGTGNPGMPPAQMDYELWQGPAPRTPYYDNRFHYNWHWFWHYGNGELGNNGIHALDICRWGLDVTFPTRVASTGGRYRYNDDQQTPDTHTALFEFPGGKHASWEGLSCNKHRDTTAFVAFYGDEGALEIDASGKYKIFDKNDKLIEEAGEAMKDSDHIENFLAAIRTGQHRNLNAEIEQGHRSTMLCHLGNIAYRTGRTLNCSAENGHILNDEAAMNLWKREYEPGWEPKI